MLTVLGRAEWRARWRSLLLLSLLAAATVGGAVALFSAAARAQNAFHRLRVETRAADVVVYRDDVLADPAAAVARLSALEGVEAAAAQGLLFVSPAGHDYIPSYDLYPLAPLRAEDRTLNTPVMVTGRAPDPHRPDEVAVSEDFAADLGVDVGDALALESMTADWIDVAFEGGDPGTRDGPSMTVEVVGLARTPADFSRWANILHLTPAFVDHYGDGFLVRGGVQLDLSPAAMTDIERSGALHGLEEIEQSPFGADAGTEDGLRTIAAALNLVAATAIVAGSSATGLMAVRLAQLVLRERATLAALGTTRRQQLGLVILVVLPWLAGGAVVGCAAGAVASPLLLVGLARAVDPAPTSIVVEAGRLAAVTVLALAGAVLIAVVAAGRAARSDGARPSTVEGSLLAELHHPLPVTLGVRHALFGAAQRGGRTSRTALGAVAAGTAAAVGALAVSASIARIVEDPTLTGQAGAARIVDSGEALTVYDRVMPMLEEDGRVDLLAGLHVSFDISAGGRELVTMVLDARRGELQASVVDGRMPRQADEVALGPATLEALDANVGDVVELAGTASSAEFRIVGSLLFPEGDFRHDEGAGMTLEGGDRLLGDARAEAQLHQVAFDWGPEVDAPAADAELRAAGLALFTTAGGLQPPVVTHLGEVEVLPRYLAGFVAALSLSTLGHALAVSTRLRSREIGILRAIGMTARGASSVLPVHAATLVVVALAVGVPLGLAAGRLVWASIAERAHVVVMVVFPWTAVALVVVGGVVAGMALVVGPAWRSLRLRPAETLRAE